MATLVKKHHSTDDDAVIANTLRVAELAAEKKAQAICALDLRGLTVVADTFVLCNATSEPQLKAVFEHVKVGMKKIDIAPLHVEGASKDGWMLVDYGDIILHIFRPEARDFYDLEGLWGDAPKIDLALDA